MRAIKPLIHIVGAVELLMRKAGRGTAERLNLAAPEAASPLADILMLKKNIQVLEHGLTPLASYVPVHKLVLT